MENKIYGRFISGVGSEEPADSLIYDTEFDFKNRTLFFRAKLSEGVEINKDSGIHGRPSKDLFEFNGKVQGDFVSGTIEHKSGYDLIEKGETFFLELKRDTGTEKFYSPISPKTKNELEKYLSDTTWRPSW
ncbi:hypothetical protein AAKU61_004071 [Undibacterium sp. GrIS 1.2]|uniref:hypothetical protein n=1 Tax=Undibacterium sp. GrIS 1.2 TaxID=3143933 RepID=UPI003394FBCD